MANTGRLFRFVVVGIDTKGDAVFGVGRDYDVDELRDGILRSGIVHDVSIISRTSFSRHIYGDLPVIYRRVLRDNFDAIEFGFESLDESYPKDEPKVLLYFESPFRFGLANWRA